MDVSCLYPATTSMAPAVPLRSWGASVVAQAYFEGIIESRRAAEEAREELESEYRERMGREEAEDA